VTTESIAKFGQLYLQKGVWQGKRLLSEQWVETATREHIPNASPSGDKTADWEQGYGYQFWRCQHDAYRADGAFGQFCVVMPKQGAVLAITSAVESMQAVLDLAYQYLLPAMEDKPLTESPARQRMLESQLDTLAIPPVKGETASPVAVNISGKTYFIRAQEAATPKDEEAVQTVTLHFNEKDCLLVITTANKEHHLRCAYNEWLAGVTKFYDQPSAKVEASGAWTDTHTFTLKIFSIETPHSLMMTFQFGRESLTLKRRWNVSFGPLELPVLMGHIRS
jgi:hypothetical protein